MKRIYLILGILACFPLILPAQLPNPALVGYWHNWNDINAPYIALNNIDNRYNVIEIAFAVPVSSTDMTMTFVPTGVTQYDFINQIQALQSQGKKVILSIGGAGVTIDLTTLPNKIAFINSINAIIDTFGFDGIDIDIESGNSILITAGTIASPSNVAQLNLIDAVSQIMTNYRTHFNRKMLLTMAPETAYVQGGQSAFGNIWGGYLPIIHAISDSLDLLQVQLYNSGSMYGIDGGIYNQGTADFIVSMTEAVISGFNTNGGQFNGLPQEKIAIALPACNSAGGGFIDSATVKQAINYLRGNGPAPGAYTLVNAASYPNIRGMMTWSINWDAVDNCESAYNYASNFEDIFYVATPVSDNLKNCLSKVFPNPSNRNITIATNQEADITITNIVGANIYHYKKINSTFDVALEEQGIYFIKVKTRDKSEVHKIVINQ